MNCAKDPPPVRPSTRKTVSQSANLRSHPPSLYLDAGKALCFSFSLSKKNMPDRRLPTNQRAPMLTTINDRSMPSLNIRRKLMFIPSRGPALKRPSHGKLKLANPCWQTQVGVCERHKNSRQSRFYLTPTVCKRVCRLFMCRLTRLGEVDRLGSLLPAAVQERSPR